MNATGTITERSPRRGGLVGPAILVALGVVFLLNNLGYLGWGVWGTLLRLWPVLLPVVVVSASRSGVLLHPAANTATATSIHRLLRFNCCSVSPVSGE